MGECYPVSPGVLMDVELARKIVAKRRPNARLYVPDAMYILKRGEAGCNRRRARSGRARNRRGPLTDEPVLMMLVAGIRVLIDGWHRAYYAHTKGRKFLRAHLLTPSEARRCSLFLHQVKREKR